MSTVNKRSKLERGVTHEGAPTVVVGAEEQLCRAVMSCLLWENTFYEEGVDIAERISKLIPSVDPLKVAQMAIDARSLMKLRHIPLFVAREMVRYEPHKALVGKLLPEIIQRPDELAEFLAIYWKNGKEKLAAQVKKGLAVAFTKFNEYSLAKYNQDNAVKLRDVLFLCHAKPITGISGFTKEERKDGKGFPKDEGSQLFRKLVEGKMEIPDTWEVELSKSENKKASWERLLSEKKLGGFALIRNLRNMTQEKVDRKLIVKALEEMKVDRILPYRFIAAARYAPDFESELEQAMFKSIEGKEKIKGRTVLLIDVSGSMDAPLSNRSEMKRDDAAYGLAILARELCEDVAIYSFSNYCRKIPARRGFALRDAIRESQAHYGTSTGAAVEKINKDDAYDRLIIITDEQSHDTIPAPKVKSKAYIINVASYQNGIGYGKWTHINGFSEAVLDFVRLHEEGYRPSEISKVLVAKMKDVETSKLKKGTKKHAKKR